MLVINYSTCRKALSYSRKLKDKPEQVQGFH
jgi:hypothetical protein